MHTTAVQVNDIAPAGSGKVLALSSDIAESTDSGATWTSWYPTVQGGAFIGVLKDLYFTNSTNGFVVGSADLDAQYLIMSSSNGGHDWQVVDYSNSGPWPRRYNAIHIQGSYGYACGTTGAMRRSTTGGGTWGVMPSPTTDELINVHFTAEQSGVVQSGTKIWSTTNAGTNWTLRITGTDLGGLSSVDSTVFAAGDNAFYTGTDHGAVWQTQAAPFTDPKAVHALNLDTIYVATEQGIWVTFNGGSNWGTYPAPADQQVNDIHFISAGIGVAGAESGEVLVTTTGGGPAFLAASFTHGISYYCDSAKVTLNNTSYTGLTYSWTVNGVPLPTVTPVEHWLYDSVNVVDYALTVSDGLNTGTVHWTDTILVQHAIAVDAGPDVVVCLGNTALLQATGAEQYFWTPWTGLTTWGNDTTTFVGQAPMTYVVEGRTPAGSSMYCWDTDTIQILAPPPADPGPWTDMIQLPSHGISRIAAFSENAAMVSMTVAPNSLYMTLDGGATVLMKQRPVQDLAMFDPFVGYAYGGQPNGDSDIWRTLNGGDSWDLVFQVQQPDYVRTVVAPDPMIAYAVTEVLGGSHAVMRTTDQGANWTNFLVSDSIHFTTMACSSVDHCIVPYEVIGDPDTTHAMVTFDGWATYQHVVVGPGGGINVSMVNDSVAHIVIISGWGGYYVARTMDGGLHWAVADLHVDNDGVWPSLPPAFADIQHGLLVGMDSDIRLTEDGGACWQYALNGWPATVGGGGGSYFLTDLKAVPGAYFRTVDETGNRALQRMTVGPLAPLALQFNLNPYSLCDTAMLQIWNASTGYTSYEWLLDGTSVSTAFAPVNIQVGTGTHVLTLIGTNGLDVDTIAQVFTVVPPGGLTPTITQPVDATVLAGQSATFQFTATPPPSQVLWYHDGVLIPGANGTTLVLTNAGPNDVGEYHATALYAGCGGNEVHHTDTVSLSVIGVGLTATTGIAAPFHVGPVPFNDRLFITAATEGIHELRILSVEGQLVDERTWSGTSTLEMATADLPAGAYVLQVNDAHGMQAMVIIKIGSR